tara:strand:- start:2341 stop:3072 length:732 start_codon:yes stop_codon:yes gene_type:complete
MYSIKDINENVCEKNNILNEEQLSYIINLLNKTKITNNDIFSNNSQYRIDLFDNDYITNTIFSIIKEKFNYNGIIEEVYCKIQSYCDNEKYNIIRENECYTIFSLDINKYDFNLSIKDTIDITIKKSYVNKLELDKNIKNDILIELENNYKINDSLKIMKPYNNHSNDDELRRLFFIERQNFEDFHGYTYFLPLDNEGLYGVSYEHIHNNCIKFPGHYIQKMKPYHKLVNHRRISIIFICKNI